MKHRLGILLISGGVAMAAGAAEFPHQTAIYTRTTTGPMINMSSEVYARFAANFKDYLEAEWREEKTPMGQTRSLTLSQGGIIYTLDLTNRQCTKMDVSKMSEQFVQGRDPRAFAEAMKQQMGLQEAGGCEGAGLKGTKLQSSFMSMCLYKEMLPLWVEAMGSTTRITQIRFDQTLPADKISLPKGVECVAQTIPMQGGMPGGAGMGGGPGAGGAQDMPDMEEAMKQAQEALKQMQEMMKQQPPQ